MADEYTLRIIDTVFEDLAASKQLTDENAQLLYAAFEGKLHESFFLIDRNAVERVSCQTGRMLYRVSDACFLKDDRPNPWHTCLISPRYCSCPEFLNAAVCEQSAVMCRHALAVALVDALDLLPAQEPIDDEEFAELMYRWTV